MTLALALAIPNGTVENGFSIKILEELELFYTREGGGEEPKFMASSEEIELGLLFLEEPKPAKEAMLISKDVNTHDMMINIFY